MTIPHPSWFKLRWRLTLLLAILMICLMGFLTWWWLTHQAKKPLANHLELPSPTQALSLPERLPSQMLEKTSTPAPRVTPTLTPTVSQIFSSLPTTPPTTTPKPNSTASTPTSTPPTPTFTPSVLTPTPTPLPAITNGDFSQGLTAWQTQGEVEVLPVLSADSPTPASDTFLARLSSQSNLAWLGSHQLSQTLLLDPGTATLRFWYRLWTEETQLGFDDPALVVMLDDQVIWRVAAASAWPSNIDVSVLTASAGQPVTSGWELVSLPLTKFLTSNQSHVLRFVAGQTGDQALPTWADVSQVSLVATLPEPALTIPSWWPTAVSGEWPQFAQFSSNVLMNELIGSLPEMESALTWQELFQRLQLPVQWQSHTLTTLGSLQTQSWLPADWLIDVAQPQPNFSFPFSLSQEGFTGLLVAGTDQQHPAISPQPLPTGVQWSGWDTVWNLLGKPQSVIWLDESGQ